MLEHGPARVPGGNGADRVADRLDGFRQETGITRSPGEQVEGLAKRARKDRSPERPGGSGVPGPPEQPDRTLDVRPGVLPPVPSHPPKCPQFPEGEPHFLPHDVNGAERPGPQFQHRAPPVLRCSLDPDGAMADSRPAAPWGPDPACT